MALKKPTPGSPIMVTVGDRGECQVRFTLRILKEMETKSGLTIMSAMQNMQSPSTISTLLFFGLKLKQSDITPDWIDDNVEGTALLGLLPYIVYAMSGEWPDKLVEKNGLSLETENGLQIVNGLVVGTGSTSGQSDATTSGSPSANSGT